MESKIYSKGDYQMFINAITVFKDFNDTITFNDGKAFFKAFAGRIHASVELNCSVDVELTSLTLRIPILNAYIGDTVEIGYDNRSMIINNGQDIIKFPKTIDSTKITEQEFNDKFNTFVNKENLVFSWDIPADKYGIINKYMNGFQTQSFIISKEPNSTQLKIIIGDQVSIGSVEVKTFDLLMNDYQGLNDQKIISKCWLDYWGPLGKSLKTMNLSVYYYPEKDILIYVCNVETEYGKIKIFSASERIAPEYLDE